MSDQNKTTVETQRWLAYAKRDLDAAQALFRQGDMFPSKCVS